MRHLKSQGRDTALLMSQVEDVVVKAILASANSIISACKMFVPHSANCFGKYCSFVFLQTASRLLCRTVRFRHIDRRQFKTVAIGNQLVAIVRLRQSVGRALKIRHVGRPFNVSWRAGRRSGFKAENHVLETVATCQIKTRKRKSFVF